MAKSKNDKIILDLQKKIEEKKQQLKSAEKFSPITNCNLVWNDKRYNLHATSKADIMYLTASLSLLKKESQELFPNENLTIASFDIDDWLSDLKAKYTQVNRSLEEAKLKKMMDQLEARKSEDLKTQSLFENILSQI